jgi:hypothetical protein
MQASDRKPPVGIVFDSSIEDALDRVFGLAMVLALSAKGEGRLASLSVSCNNLKIAGFTDMMARFYGASPSIGMHEKGRAETEVTPLVSGPFQRNTPEGKPVYNRVVQTLNDTADPVALIRNGLTAQQDQNAVVILAGAPVNLLGLLALPTSKALIQKKVRTLVIAAPFEDAPGFAKLLAEWPGPIVVADGSVGQSLLFPDDSILKDLEWAPNHPLADAYKAYQAGLTKPIEPRSSTMAAVLYAVQPQADHFKISDRGNITLLSAGRIQFSANPQGRHRHLIADEAKKENVMQAYRQLVSAKPPERRGRGGPA